MSGSVYYLGRGEAWSFPTLEDGGHSSPGDVARAAKLLGRIAGDQGPWVMVEVHPLPEIDPPINDEAAWSCRQALIDERIRSGYYDPTTRDGLRRLPVCEDSA